MHVLFTGLGRSTGFPADVDGDGDLDIAASLDAANQMAWYENIRPRSDLTGDGLVDANDIAYMLGSWGFCPEDATCRADLDGDRLVNSSDLAHLLGARGAQRCDCRARPRA